MLSFPPGKALVQTVDFLTPVVNDPYHFGRIAAANALSDIYAMGAEPWAAMNIACFPSKKLPLSVLSEILRGGADAVAEAGAANAGGHSVEDDELKYGLAVSGFVDPARCALKSGLRPGDVLLLTKPLGTGILSTAVKGQWQGAEEHEAEILRWASRLNAAGGRVIRQLGLRAATDVTGFGLGGHALEMARASGVAVEIESRALPVMGQALALAAVGLLPAGSACNRKHYAQDTETAAGADPLRLDLVFDAQTSGGLLMAVPPPRLDEARRMLLEAGDLAAEVGRVVEAGPGGPALRVLA